MIKRIVLGIVLVAAIVALLGVGAYAVGMQAYNAGYVSGQTAGGQAVAPDTSTAPQLPWGMARGGPFMHRRPFMMGHFFGFMPCLGLILILGLGFMLMRVIFGRRHWGWHRSNGDEACPPFAPWGKGAPPIFEEWHRRAHGQGAPPEPPPAA